MSRPNTMMKGLGRAMGGGASVAGIFLLILFVIYASERHSVLSGSGMQTVFNGLMALSLAAAGETLVVLTGGLDMSAGAILGLANTFIAVMMHDSPLSMVSIFLLTLVVGFGAGFVNGLWVAFARVQPIVATLATSFIWYGFALLLLPQPGGHVPPSFTHVLSGSIGGKFPNSVLLLIVVLIVWQLIRRSRFGVNMYAIGSDESAAFTSGIPVKRVKLWAYSLAGVFYALAGMFLGTIMSSGDATIGAAYLLPVVAAVVIGGTSLAGGRGTMVGSLIGAAILTILSNVLFVLGVSSFYTDIFQGVIIIVAVVFGNFGSLAGRWRRFAPTRADNEK
jgi:ribose transport system permease protein